jgi:hypothetical protein
MVTFILWPTAVVAMIVVLAVLVGELWGRRVLVDLHGVERLSWSLFLGVGLLATASWIGVVARIGPWAGVLAVALASTPRMLRMLREVAGSATAAASELGRVARRHPVVAAAAAVGGTLLFVASWYPPTGFDDTTYHLPWVEALVRADGELFLDRLRFPAFPLFAESVWALAAAAAGDRGAQGLSVVATLGTAGLLWGWAARRVTGWWRVLPALWWLGHPIVVRYSATAYVEPWLAWATVAALAAVDRARTGSAAAGWWWIAGCAAGWALAIKYLGALVALAVGVAAVASRRLPAIVAAAGGGILAAAPWIAVVVALTGNPVFPFATGFFGVTSWAPDLGSATQVQWSRTVTWLWETMVARERLGWQPPYSPLLLVAALAALLLRQAELVRHWPVLAYAVSAAATFPLLPPDSRYLLPMVAVSGIWLVTVVSRVSVGWHRRWVGVASLTLALPGPAYLAWHLLRLGALPLSAEGERLLLTRHYPRYGAVLAIERDTPPETVVYAFAAQNLRHHLHRPMLGEVNGPFAYHGVMRLGGDVEAVDRVLCGFGAEVLMMPTGVRPSPVPIHPHWRPMFRDAETFVLRLHCSNRGVGDR